jgi:hypothetical protein
MTPCCYGFRSTKLMGRNQVTGIDEYQCSRDIAVFVCCKIKGLRLSELSVT